LKVEPNFETFSVGVKPDINNSRREIMDAIAILGGRENPNEPPRYHNHTFCMERLVVGVHSLMEIAPDSFAEIFGEGEPRYKKSFMDWLAARLKGDVRGA